MYDLGIILRDARKRLGYTQRQIAEWAGVSPTTVVRWENNYKTPSAEHMMKLSSLLRVPTDVLLGKSSDETLLIGDLTENQKNIIRLLLDEFRTPVKKAALTDRQTKILTSVIEEIMHQK